MKCYVQDRSKPTPDVCYKQKDIQRINSSEGYMET